MQPNLIINRMAVVPPLVPVLITKIEKGTFSFVSPESLSCSLALSTCFTPSHPVTTLLSVLLHPSGSPPPLDFFIDGAGLLSFSLSLKLVVFLTTARICRNTQQIILTSCQLKASIDLCHFGAPHSHNEFAYGNTDKSVGCHWSRTCAALAFQSKGYSVGSTHI